MGFDLHWNDYVGEEPDVDDAMSAHECWTLEAEHGQMSLSSGAMAELRIEMHERDMLNGCDVCLPQPEEFGLRGPVPHPGSEISDDPAYRAFEETYWNALAYECDAPGIPAIKLLSNDGWLITTAQIASALEQNARFPESENTLWDIWVRFLFGGLRHGGILVL